MDEKICRDGNDVKIQFEAKLSDLEKSIKLCKEDEDELANDTKQTANYIKEFSKTIDKKLNYEIDSKKVKTEEFHYKFDDSLQEKAKIEKQDHMSCIEEKVSFYKKETKCKTEHLKVTKKLLLKQNNGLELTPRKSKTSTQKKPKEHICKICNYRSFRADTYKDHVRTHIKDRFFQCAHCKYSSIRKTTLRKHLFAVHIEEFDNLKEEKIKYFKCSLCEKTYSTRCNILRHIRQKHNEDNQLYENRFLTCAFCEFSTSNRFTLKNHVETHNDKSGFECSHCTKSYKRKDLLNKHILDAHSKELVFKCKTCQRKYATKRGLQGHLRKNKKIHSDHLQTKCLKPMFKCPFQLCEKAFFYKCRLRDHVLFHTREHPYKCSLCSKDFWTHTTLKYHMYMHTKEPAFKCPTCEFSTYDLSSLRKHKLTSCRHAFSFQCEHCNYACNGRRYMESHVKKHSRKMQLQCAHCDFSTDKRLSLIHHLNSEKCRRMWYGIDEEEGVF